MTVPSNLVHCAVIKILRNVRLSFVNKRWPIICLFIQHIPIEFNSRKQTLSLCFLCGPVRLNVVLRMSWPPWEWDAGPNECVELGAVTDRNSWVPFNRKLATDRTYSALLGARSRNLFSISLWYIASVRLSFSDL